MRALDVLRLEVLSAALISVRMFLPSAALGARRRLVVISASVEETVCGFAGIGALMTVANDFGLKAQIGRSCG